MDLAVLRRCDALVIGPSTFGWWAAWLARLPVGRVIAPLDVVNPRLPLRHPMLAGFNRTEYYPSKWRLLPNDGSPHVGW